MPTLYLIDGTGGAGKSDFIDYCTKKNSMQNSLIIKYTTKEIKTFEKSKEDLCYCDIQEYNRIKRESRGFYEYQFPSTSNINYLILKSDIDKALKKYRNVYIIVRSVEVIMRIKQDYERYFNVNVKTLFLYCEESITRERMLKQLRNESLTEEELEALVQKRIDSNKDCLYQYMSSFEKRVYDHLVLNSVDKESYKLSLNKLLGMYDRFDDKFSPLKAFIIMPFMSGREWLHFHEVSEAIVRGAKQQGVVAVRQDEACMSSISEIIEGIKRSIEDNYLFIVDLSSSRQNCYYELGLAEQLKTKNIILIKEKNEALAFDVQGRFCYEYSFQGTDYDAITSIVSKQIKKFISESIFVTDEIEEKMQEVKGIC
ncbi:MAG: hypothetical protein J6B29_05775 [Clostridia bacterium]|nr:hypothetical protein [Clostridia bacterium]